MTVEYETRKPVDPFKRPFPTMLILVIILIIIIAFSVMRCVRNAPTIEPRAVQPAATNTTMPEPEQPKPLPSAGEKQINVQDLRAPEFPEVDEEMGSVI